MTKVCATFGVPNKCTNQQWVMSIMTCWDRYTSRRRSDLSSFTTTYIYTTSVVYNHNFSWYQYWFTFTHFWQIPQICFGWSTTGLPILFYYFHICAVLFVKLFPLAEVLLKRFGAFSGKWTPVRVAYLSHWFSWIVDFRCPSPYLIYVSVSWHHAWSLQTHLSTITTCPHHCAPFKYTLGELHSTLCTPQSVAHRSLGVR